MLKGYAVRFLSNLAHLWLRHASYHRELVLTINPLIGQLYLVMESFVTTFNISDF